MRTITGNRVCAHAPGAVRNDLGRACDLNGPCISSSLTGLGRMICECFPPAAFFVACSPGRSLPILATTVTFSLLGGILHRDKAAGAGPINTPLPALCPPCYGYKKSVLPVSPSSLSPIHATGPRIPSSLLRATSVLKTIVTGENYTESNPGFTTQWYSMWLLNTARAELKFFPTPEGIPGGYAILSHVWDEHEQSFQDIQALRERCAKDGTNPRDLASDKIRNFCILAERDGYQWGWDDTCCIDKTSSTDLSEAITAMYRYYSLADVCYAYLRDVPTDCDLHAPGSAFRKSRWHRRGWTLQELIAPPLVVLLSKTWEPLGSKADLAPLLEEITRVPTDILNLRDTLSSYCVAARMAWAASRETTRPEDEAYCLMGLFGIFMPPLYGEGENAFLRLQEEIVRRVDDPSIFAWGEIYGQQDSDVMLSENEAERSTLSHDRLFARSPSDFRLGHRMRCREKFTPQGYSLLGGYYFRGPADLSMLPTFTITPYAVESHVPVYAPFPQADFIVVLLWGIELRLPELAPQNLGVLLTKTPSPDRTRQRYEPTSQPSTFKRLFTFPCDSSWLGITPRSRLEWKTVFIAHAPPTSGPEPLALHLFTRSIHVPFHIPRSHVAELLRAPGVASAALHGSDGTQDGSTGTMTLAFTIQPPGSDVRFSVAIHLGLCSRRASSGDPKHWARAKRQRNSAGAGKASGSVAAAAAAAGEEPEHDCAKHHVDEWAGRSRTFAIGPGPGDALQRLRVGLSFEPYALNPAWVRKAHISLSVRRASPGAEQPQREE